MMVLLKINLQINEDIDWFWVVEISQVWLLTLASRLNAYIVAVPMTYVDSLHNELKSILKEHSCFYTSAFSQDLPPVLVLFRTVGRSKNPGMPELWTIRWAPLAHLILIIVHMNISVVFIKFDTKILQLI